MIIDDVIIQICAGKGGDGHISFRREKFVARGGPDGGNGGNGGNIYFQGVSDLTALKQFRHNRKIQAPDGQPGMKKKKHGGNGNDILIRIPIGTKIKDTNTLEEWELRLGEKICMARGGRGGRGNFEIRTSQDKAPRYAEAGKLGRKRMLHLDLQYIADVGLIGLPSAGKSSLLNVLTKAHAKIGDYPFTTLEPNLGEMDGNIIADIPGLIEGAHQGKGLGIKFLKHIEKTRLLLHCIDITGQNLFKDYQSIHNELEKFNEELLKKREIIVLTKSDLVNRSQAQALEDTLKKLRKHIIIVSIIDDKSIVELKAVIKKMLKT